MERPTCKTCPYWIGKEKDGWGKCTKRAPQPLPFSAWPDDQFHVYWPTTLSHEGCGEHPSFKAYIASLKPPRAIPEMEAEIAMIQGEIRTAIDEHETVWHGCP